MRLPFDAVLCDFDGVIRFYDHVEVAALETSFGIEPGTTARMAFAPRREPHGSFGSLSRLQDRDGVFAEGLDAGVGAVGGLLACDSGGQMALGLG